LILDDTQATGILGRRTPHGSPYGQGGGGSLRWHDVGNADASRILLVTSCAKAFGAPVAALSGARGVIDDFEDRSQTRVHCSPPSVPAVRSLSRALSINQEMGDRLRSRLLGLIHRFRDGLSAEGVPIGPGVFPLQSLPIPRGWHPHDVQAVLSRRSVFAVLTRSGGGASRRISFLLNACHSARDVDHAVEIVSPLYAAQAFRKAP
jgi:8-amino-7-oxononanoate synthase